MTELSVTRFGLFTRSAARNTALGMGLVAIGASIAIALSSFSTWFPGKAKARFAVVDLASVVQKNQQATVALIASGVADRYAREAALASAQSFGRRLDAAVVELSRDCGCVLLMREAVVAGEVEDLTPVLLSRLAKQ